MSYRITALEVSDYKRIKTVKITPAADTAIILLGGKNAQGKSSILDALTAAFGGKRAAAGDPVRHGEKEAAIYVELDGGRLTIDRTIAPDGSTTLEVRDVDGAVRKPQEVLDKLVGSRFLDPLLWLQLPMKEQRAQLMKLIPNADRIDVLNDKRQRAFDRRTELGRDLVKAKGELDRLPVLPTPTEIDVAKASAELQAFNVQQRTGDGLGNALALAKAAREIADQNFNAQLAALGKLKDQLAAAEAQLPILGEVLKRSTERELAAKTKLDEAVEAWQASEARRTQLEVDIAMAGEHNRAVAAAAAQNARRAETAAAVEKLTKDVEVCATAITTVDERKAEILAAAKLPVEGLKVSDDGVELNGVPFAQASDAEKWRVALALAIAASPGLHDVWIRDGALLDGDSLKLVAEHAQAAGKRCWIERVGTADAGAIVIQDGQVVA